jgi:DNA-directed RNA polymerase subunit L
MNWILITDGIIVVGITLAFAGTIWYLVTHNPNYDPKELLKQPWKIFDLIDHAKDNVTEGLKKIKEETQQAIDTTKAVKEEVKAIVKQVQDTAAEVKEDIKELGDKK